MAIIRLSIKTFLNTDDGTVVTEDQAAALIASAVLRQKNLTINQTVAQIKGVDQKTIDFNLAGLHGNVDPSRGFLVMVYLSGANGLQRLYEKEIIDPADQSLIRGSYSDYISLEFDQ